MFVERFVDRDRQMKAMETAREVGSLEDLIDILKDIPKDEYLRGAYYCRMVELQSTLSPVGRLIADRYVEKFREVV